MTDKKNLAFQQTDDVFAVLDEILSSLNNGANAALPAPETVSHYVLDANRKLFLDAVVDLNIIEVTKRIIRWNMEDAEVAPADRKPIWIYIMNYGGSADYSWQLIDVMLASETPVYTVNLGVCGSGGALIFLAGHKRFMMERSNLMIHEGSAEFSGDAQKINDAADSYKKMLRAMNEYILSRTAIPSATLSRKKNNDWELSAKYCLEHGACEHIVTKLSDIL